MVTRILENLFGLLSDSGSNALKSHPLGAKFEMQP
jgi:hypothetical protein